MKTKTLHFKVNDISRTQGHNAVAACAYRVGLNLTDAKTGEVHRYARRGGVVQAALLAAVNSPEWMQDDNQKRLWERFGNEIERAEDGHNKRATALLAIDWQAAAPRELTPLQNWRLALTFAALLNARGLAVAVAFHETDASDGGKNPHFHFLVPQRQTDKDGFSGKRYYEFTGNPNAIRQAHKRLREEYYRCVNDALADAGIEGIIYDPNKQEGIEPGAHKGKVQTAIERKEQQARWAKIETFLRPALAGLHETGETYQEGLSAGWWERKQDAAFWKEQELFPAPPKPVPVSASADVPAASAALAVSAAASSPDPAPAVPSPDPASVAVAASPPAPASSWQERAARSPPADRSR